MTLGLLPALIAVAGAAAVIVVVGPRLAHVADRLADRTGLGEAVAGALLLGAATSLPGIVTTAVGASEGDGGFAVSNALGGIAVQTFFISVADLGLRRVNLEHSAASLPNLVNSTSLLTLLSLVLVGVAGPRVEVLGVHPLSAVLVGVYLYGLRISREAHQAPMWLPEETAETQADNPDEDDSGEPVRRTWVRFGALAAVLATAGWVIGQGGLSIASASGFSSVEVATLLTGVVTSLPELVVLLAAVRMGSPTLGIGNIIGGNAFDVMFVPVADVFFRRGSIYHAVDAETVFVLGLTLSMTAVFAAGLLSRQRKGIGFEGTSILVLYAVGALTLLVGF